MIPEPPFTNIPKPDPNGGAGSGNPNDRETRYKGSAHQTASDKEETQ